MWKAFSEVVRPFLQKPKTECEFVFIIGSIVREIVAWNWPIVYFVNMIR